MSISHVNFERLVDYIYEENAKAYKNYELVTVREVAKKFKLNVAIVCDFVEEREDMEFEYRVNGDDESVSNILNFISVADYIIKIKESWIVMKRVIVEIPFLYDKDESIKYAKACIIDCLKRNESAILPEFMYQYENFLNSENLCEMAIGIAASMAWSKSADYVVVYTDYGINHNMQICIDEHKKRGTNIVYRSLDNANTQCFKSKEAVL